MTVTLEQVLLYAGALAILVLTPGPVVVALIARAATGGVRAAVPLSLGVVVGDIIWPLLAIFGVSLLVSLYADFLTLLRWFGAGVLIWMGVGLIRHAGDALRSDPSLKAQGDWAAFMAGLAVIAGNPKAILFYIGILPGFFDVGAINGWDIALICFVSGLVPFVGNVIWAGLFSVARKWLQSPRAVRNTNIVAGCLLILVGVFVAASA
jgi:threonine/homoserine/homoserine lactone efflux protein